jgi:hypothetical protein
LDECLPRPLKMDLPGYDVATVPEMGWAGIKNGALLKLVEPAFDVFLTIDGNLRFQQNLRSMDLSFIVLSAFNNRIETLRPLMPRVLVALQSVVTGDVVRIEA